MFMKDAMVEFDLECKVRRLAKGTINNYGKHLSYLLHYLEEQEITRLEDISRVHIKQFLLIKEDQGCKPQYINDLLKVFKTFFRYCVDEEYLKVNPAAKVKNVRQPKVLIRTFNEDEVLTMRDEQIRDGHLVVWGKGSKERVVPFSPYLAKLLMKYRIARDAYFEMKNTTPQAYFFLSYRGKRMTQEIVSKIMKQTAAAVGVRADIRVSPHTCRHAIFLNYCYFLISYAIMKQS